MNNLLSWIQQLLLPILKVWPVWVALALSGYVLKRTSLKVYAIWLMWLGFCLIVLLLVIQFIFLLSYPIGNQLSNLTLDPSGSERLPLYVSFRKGNLHIINSPKQQQIQVKSYDYKPGYVVEKSVHKDSVGGKQLLVDAILVHRGQEIPLLFQHQSQVEIEIPAIFLQKQDYSINEATATLDFSESESNEIAILALMSDISVSLPKTSGQKEVTVQVESSSGRFYVPEGPTYIFVTNSSLPIIFPTSFEKVGDQTYQKKGDSASIVTVRITSRMPRSLEVILVNEDNK